ncbi:MAG: carbamoyltransferase HypF, partial [Cyanobium sp.]
AALRPFPLPGGDRASREPRRCGLGLLAAAGAWALAHPGARDCVEAFPPPERQLLHQALLQGCHTPTTSSLGRLLDGCVSLLGLAQTLSYEGEGGQAPLGRWDWEPLLGSLLADRAAGVDPALAAWQLERAIVAGIVEGACAAATFTGCRVVALAGGCFQNRSLLEGCLQGLRQRCLTPHWGERVPCNDGGLALGQAWAVQASQMAL